MYRIYKGQPFTIASAEIRRGQWDLQIWIMGEKNMRFSITRQFKTFREAERYGVFWVHQWVDDGKPPLAHPIEKTEAHLGPVLPAVKARGLCYRCLVLLKCIFGYEMFS